MLTLAQLAECLDGECYGDPNICLQGIASLSQASALDLSYIDDPAKLNILSQTKAGAVLLLPSFLNSCPVNAIIVHDPYLALVKAIDILKRPSNEENSIHKTAFVHPDAKIEEDVYIGPNASIGKNVYLGKSVHIGANSVIEDNVSVGDNSFIANQVSIHSHSCIGNEVKIDSGTVIAAQPFNHSKYQGDWLPGLALGNVLIEDKVKIGANTVIDRGALDDTFVGRSVCIDNLVHIAHDAHIGAFSSLAAGVVIGACTKIGAHCIIGGSSCIAPNVMLCDDVVITGMSTVAKSINKAGIYSSGTTVSKHHTWRKNASRFRHLDKYIRRFNRLK